MTKYYILISKMFHEAFSEAVLLMRVRVSSLRHRRIRLWSVALGIFVLSVFVIVGWVMLNVTSAMYVEIPVFGQLFNRHVGESTKLYDRTGKVLIYDTEGSMRRVTVPVSEISPYLVKATIAIEDASFYEHFGIRPTSIFRALVANIKTRSLNQGGSTITQQLVKNTLLTEDKKLIRKIKEGVLALRIEREYSKNEILETYLNETPYGGTIYGAEEASRAYFGTSAKDLTLSEAAYLAALPQAPTYFSPWGSHKALLTERHDLVLTLMREQGMISEDEYKNARAEEVHFSERGTERIKAPHFAFYVLEELEKKYGKKRVYEDGLQVITTLNLDLQKESEEIIRVGALKNEKNFNASNAGVVVVDPRSGQVLVMVGSRDYFDDTVDGQVNVALALRQPGSAFKPIVYATAFKKGYTPDTVLYNLKTQFSTACAASNLSSEYPCYSPENYDGTYNGPMTMRDALAQSVNVVGIKTLYLSGIKESLATARSLGITTLKDAQHYGLALVLGGGEVTLLEMTAAYGAFANDGEQFPTTPILSVRAADGSILESFIPASNEVLDPKVARTINDVLSDNEARTPAFGSESPLYFKDTDLAVKTGTTNDYRDMWVIGYTPTVVVGAWAGNNDNTPMVKKTSSFILAPMWHAVTEKAIARFPSQPFVPPDGNFASIPSPLATSTDIEHRVAEGIHEILYWVDKDNPHGPPPLKPYMDPQLALWEYPLLLWTLEQTVAKFALELGEIHNAGATPQDPTLPNISISMPTGGMSVPANQFFLAGINYSAVGDITNVHYFLNGVSVGTADSAPFTHSIMAGNGPKAVLRAIAVGPSGVYESSAVILVGESPALTVVD